MLHSDQVVRLVIHLGAVAEKKKDRFITSSDRVGNGAIDYTFAISRHRVLISPPAASEKIALLKKEMADCTEVSDEKASIVRDEEEEDSKQHQGPPDKYNVVYWTILLIGEPFKNPSNFAGNSF